MFDKDPYGKFPKSSVENLLIMEYKYWLKDFSAAFGFPYKGNEDFIRYLQSDGRQNEFVSFLMGAVPSPRYEYYQNSDF